MRYKKQILTVAAISAFALMFWACAPKPTTTRTLIEQQQQQQKASQKTNQ